jgi:hypothetical protein
MSMRTLAAEKDPETKIVKKGDMFKVRFKALKIEPGHNERNMKSPRTLAHIESMYVALINGATLPPLEVRVDHKDKIWIVDGQCRHAAYAKAIKNHPELNIDWIDALHFDGNDAARTHKMLTSNQGLALTPLEMARGYKRLKNFNWTVEAIAVGHGMSTEQVKQLLRLANANMDVQNFVEEDKIGAYEAIELLKKHSDDTGRIIAEQLELANKRGKDRVTKAGMEGRALPKKLITGLVSTVDTFASRLNKHARLQIASFEKMGEEELKGKTIEIDAAALVELLKVQGEMEDVRKKQREKVLAAEEKMKQAGIPM